MSFTNQSDLMLEDNASKYPAIELLCKLGYTYISPEDAQKERGTLYNVLLKDVLRKQLQRINQFEFNNVFYKFSADNIERAIAELDVPLTEGLVKTSERIYDALMLGKSFPEKLVDGTTKSFNLNYIDWDNFENNVFHVTEEFSCDSWDKQKNARPDIVVFVNGIPFAVIESKAPDISEVQAIEQTIRNQGADYIPQLFKYVQMVVATNKNAVKYATVGTGKKFWNVWREQDTEWQANIIDQIVAGRIPTEQDKTLVSLFEISRLRKFAKYFVVYDANIKKICRYQQFFAVEAIMKTIAQSDSAGNRQSGVIWHTQGSGKSLTMVMVSKYILEELTSVSPKVVVVTDRKELDKQIAKTFAHTRLLPARATSGKNLCDLINEGKADVITSIINKFNTVDNQGVKNNSRDIFVLVDESHRSNYGSLATKMRTVFPNACYIGFTGTPLLKHEKNTLQTFGKLIHKYTIKDGVEDKAIVPLIYEGRFVDQTVDEANIDLWFKVVTKKLNKAQIAELKAKWSSIQKLASSDSRIRRVAIDIYQHFMDGYKESGFKAMLACNFKRDAVRYKQIFDTLCDIRTEVVISAPDMREGHEDVDESSDNLVVSFWNKMMKQYDNADDYEDTLKNQFIDGEIDILIVCSKLLTGFDAPRTQVLYIDKELKEHGLLQAIARTNRLYDGKDFGYIVDYRGLIDNLDAAMEVYSGAGLENYDTADIKGVVVDVMSCVAKLRETYSQLWDVFATINNKKDPEEFEIFLADTDARGKFYDTLCSYGRAFIMVMNSTKAFAAFERKEIEMFRETFVFFSKIRKSVKIRYADALDNSEYEPQMRNLLDTYMSVKDVQVVYSPIDIMNVGEFEKVIEKLPSDRSKADAIVSHLTKRIKLNRDEDPAFYDSFSKMINDVLEAFKNKILSEKEYFKKMFGVMNDFRKGDTKQRFPDKIAGDLHAQAFYGVINPILSSQYKLENEIIADIALSITDIIRKHDKVDWKNNIDVHNRIRQDIDDLFYEMENNQGIVVDLDDVDKISESVLNVAMRRF
jgi:type I restriction enzyme R subunit